jgi:glycosyltransferase involved in cell wall biosynthesis
VLCNSEATAREVHGRLGVPLRRLVPIRLGFDPGRLRPLHLERKPFFLVLGRHDPHKNLNGVLRAFAAVPDPEKTLRLKLVGPHDGRYTPRLQRLAQELGIGPRCDWLPWVSDAERLELLNRCRALLMVSFWEGFGLPALEAMACEAPVIAARAGALPEVVGDAALLVDPHRPTEIAAAMHQLLGDGVLARTLGQAGAVRAGHFRWDRTATDLLGVLAELA